VETGEGALMHDGLAFALACAFLLAVTGLYLLARLTAGVEQVRDELRRLHGAPRPPSPGPRSLLFLLLTASGAWAAGPAEAALVAHQDASRLARALGGKTEALHPVRYLWSDATDPRELARLFVTMQLHVNFLSKEKPFARLAKVTPWLWRLDLTQLEMDPGYLEAARFIDPFFHVRESFAEEKRFDTFWPGGVDTAPGPTKGKEFKKGKITVVVSAGAKAPLAAPWLPAKEITELREMLYTEVPLLPAQWFLANSARQISYANEETGLGYFDALSIKDRDSYFDLLGFSQQTSKKIKQDLAAIQEISKVSPGQRVIRQFRGPTGAAYVALDFTKPARDGTPLKDVREGSIKADIEEWYIPGRNGLPYTGIFNGKGERVANAPSDAAGFGDDSELNESRDKRIHIHIACLRCHGQQVLLPIDDWMRNTFRNATHLGTPDRKESQRLQRQYFEDMQEDLETSRLLYQRAFKRATVTEDYPAGLDAGQAVEFTAHYLHAYTDYPVDIGRAAREVGVPSAQFFAALSFAAKSGKGLPTELAPFLADPARPLHRLTFERAYPKAVQLMQGFLPPADDEKGRRR
jgi:hypothetical protein